MVDQNGERLLAQIGALANPVRLRIVAELAQHEQYVSQLARDLQVSRPLLHMHLQKLEEAGLVTSRLETSESGKAMRFFAATNFVLELSPAAIRAAVPSLSDNHKEKGNRP